MSNTSAQISKNRRELLKSKGLCINCGRLPHESGKVKCLDCLKLARLSCKKYRDNNPNAKEAKNRWKNNKDSRIKNRETRKKWRLKFKYRVILFFGGKCECCCEDRLPFLQIDHINKDGNKHRLEIGRGVKLLRDMLKYPNKYSLRILCANCHFAITNLGTCPHKEDINELTKIQKDSTLTLVKRSNQ